MLGSSRSFSKALLDWYTVHRRDLPWRLPIGSSVESTVHPDPYHVLVSEAMLQQTQVATVIPYFHRFLEKFATIEALATADEQDVLRLWQGLGYYSRARNLRKAAMVVVEQFGGKLPNTVDELLKLPGVGRYTAGAIASIAFGTKAPIVDGNVVRVICRIDKITDDPREKAIVDLLWTRAEQILPSARIGDFNSALMELGATVCTPRNPQCLVCSVQRHCEAVAAGVQETIPPVKKVKVNPLEERWTFLVRAEGKFLVEQRPSTGRWAGMWQFVTVPAQENAEPADAVSSATGLRVNGLNEVGYITHALTHRRYAFTVFSCSAKSVKPVDGRVWVTLEEVDRLPLSKPQLKALEIAHAVVKK